MISLIFGYAATIIAIIGFQLKKQWQIILSQCLSNLLVALSYMVLDISRMTGGAVCLVGAIQTFINYLYFRRDMLPPKALKFIFLIAYLGASALVLSLAGTINVPYDLIPPFASVIFLLGVSTSVPRTTRFLFFINIVLWVVYDALAKPMAIANLFTHVCILISLATSIIRFDLLKKEEKTTTESNL